MLFEDGQAGSENMLLQPLTLVLEHFSGMI